jgi:SAM-dependent methyltransferase
MNSQRQLQHTITKIALRTRRVMYEAFIESLAPSAHMTILDIGVTPDRENEGSNFLEKWYPYPAQITATSIENASYLESDYPGLRFVQTSGKELPFADREFDIAFSSAVIEHVGDRANQRYFLQEMLRVSKRFFITTPDRWFPIELHTFLPIVHWLPQKHHQRLLTMLGMTAWGMTDNLNLMSERELRNLFPDGVSPSIGGPRTLGMRSNLVACGPSNRNSGAARPHASREPRR